MSLPIFPVSPLPAGMTRTIDWGETDTRYDSGAHQTDTAFVRPLYQWDVDYKLFTEIKQSSLFQFQNNVKGMTLRFLMKDAYDFRVNSVMAVRSGISTGTLFLFDTNSFFVRADTTTIGSLFSTLSGYVKLGTDYSYDQDTGLFTITGKATTDVWGVRSMQYFRKCMFASPYVETSQLWNIFAAGLKIAELP